MATIRKNQDSAQKDKRNALHADKKFCDRNSSRKADAVISESVDDEFSIDDEPFTEEELYYYRKMATKWYREHNITPPANLVCMED